MNRIDDYRRQLKGLTPAQMLEWAHSTFSAGGAVVASSLGIEDQVLTHMVSRMAEQVPLFTLDTGRLFQESYDLIDRTAKEMGVAIQMYFPNAQSVEQMIAEGGPNLFYNSVDERKRCCAVRKVEPLGRALAGKEAWIVGLRSEQSVTRAALEPIEWDQQNGLYKISPLHNWSGEQVWEYVRSHQVPYNKLHDQGYPSIGCLPCTRPVKPGEDARAGRWWWELPEHKECGLHLPTDSKTAAQQGPVIPIGTLKIDG